MGGGADMILFSSPAFKARRLKLELQKILPIIYSLQWGGFIPLIHLVNTPLKWTDNRECTYTRGAIIVSN